MFQYASYVKMVGWTPKISMTTIRESIEMLDFPAASHVHFPNFRIQEKAKQKGQTKQKLIGFQKQFPLFSHQIPMVIMVFQLFSHGFPMVFFQLRDLNPPVADAGAAGGGQLRLAQGPAEFGFATWDRGLEEMATECLKQFWI